MKKFSIITLLIFGFSFLLASNRFISKLTFEGNLQVSTQNLENVLRLKPKGIFQQTVFNERSVVLDVVSLRNLYYSLGYMDVQIEYDILEYEQDSINLIYKIDEGERYYISDISIYGNKLLTDDEIWERLNFKISDVYNSKYIRNILKTLKYFYMEKGKIQIYIIDEVNVDSNTNLVSIRVNIAEGSTYTIGKIDLEGLDKIEAKFVHRELVFKSNSIYNINNIEDSKRRLFTSGLFSSVEMIQSLDAIQEDVVNIIVKVREYQSRSIEFNFGYDQEESPMGEGAPPVSVVKGNAIWKIKNILNTTGRITFDAGLGFAINENIELYQPLKNFSAKWISPWIMNFRVPLNLKYYYDEISLSENTLNADIFTKTNGLETVFTFRHGRNYRFTGNLSYQNVASDSSGLKSDDERSLIKLHYYSHNVENLLIPTNGHYFTGNYSLFGSLMESAIFYHKFDLEFRQYVDLISPVIIAHRFKFGHIVSNNNVDLRYFDKYYLGGNTTLRGWMNPEDFNENGGLTSLLYNFELRFPIYWKIGGELFFDSGIISDELSGDIFHNLSWDIGVGITVLTPLGPGRIDFAFPEANFNNPTILYSVLYMF